MRRCRIEGASVAIAEATFRPRPANIRVFRQTRELGNLVWAGDVHCKCTLGVERAEGLRMCRSWEQKQSGLAGGDRAASKGPAGCARSRSGYKSRAEIPVISYLGPTALQAS